MRELNEAQLAIVKPPYLLIYLITSITLLDALSLSVIF